MKDKRKLFVLGWEIVDEIKNKEEVKAIEEGIEELKNKK